MSGLHTTCPGCGTGLTFAIPGSAATACPACHTWVARADAANLGKIADVAQGDTPLAIGAAGVWQGAAFTLVGCARLGSGDATWEEWYAHFPDDGRWGWLSYAQGRYAMFFERAAEALPAVASLTHDRPFDLGGETFRLAERGDAMYIAAAGELPFKPDTKRRWKYADLKGPQRAVATLSEYDTPTLFVGQRATLRDLGMDTLPRASARAEVAAKSVTCPNCSAQLTLHAGKRVVTVACGFCGSLLDARQAPLKLLKASDTLGEKPALALGTVGLLHGVSWRVVGFMVRETMVEGQVYSWREYLLYAAPKGFAWLVYSTEGSWSFVDTADDVTLSSAGHMAVYEGVHYTLHERCTARVAYVLGEFYWPVRVGERVDVTDFVAPPQTLSREQAGDEVIWSAGTHVSKRDIMAAFAPELSTAQGGAVLMKPWPHEGFFVAAVMISILACLLFFALDATKSVATVQTFFDLKKDQTIVTEPFAISRGRNVAVRVQSQRGSVALDGTWITPEADWGGGEHYGPMLFDMDVEADDSTAVYLSRRFGSTAQVQFAVRDVEPEGQPFIRVTVYESACSFDWVVTVWAVCLCWVIIMTYARHEYEGQRANNAHA